MRNWHIIKVDKCVSTNDLAKDMKMKGSLSDKTAIVTKLQSKGKGQGKNEWHSEEGKNLLVSFYRKTSLKVEQHFMLTITASLAIQNALDKVGVKSCVKWPNDIYVGERKIAGILIENTLMQDKINDTIIGLGLNINQNEFPESIPNPVSIIQILKKEVSVGYVMELVANEFDLFFNFMMEGAGEKLYHRYTENLYRLKEWSSYKFEGQVHSARIRGVLPDGKLIIETIEGEIKHFLFGEIEYLI